MKGYIMDDLIEQAADAAKNAYVPVTEKPTGAALLAESGAVYTAAGVEMHADCGCSAERIALFKAINAGETAFDALALYSEGKSIIYPAGTSLQAFSEFTDDLEMVLACDSKTTIKTLRELLPYPFKCED